MHNDSPPPGVRGNTDGGVTNRPPAAAVVAFGDEMTGGARVDTNSAWIAARLESVGYEVRLHGTAGDDADDAVALLRFMADRCETIVCTGGLGPTRDDLTRDVIASLCDRPLEYRDEAMRHIERLFKIRRREMPQRNRIQAMFPRDSVMIDNPHGTAPGIDAKVPGSNRDVRLFALPGVPAEMKTMMDAHVIPALAGGGSKSHIQTRVLKFYGIGESDMEERLGDLIARGRQPRVGITVSSATISLRITATGPDPRQCVEAIDQTEADIMRRVGDLYFGRGESTEQQHAIVETLRRRGETLQTIDVGPAATLATAFASVDPANLSASTGRAIGGTYLGGHCVIDVNDSESVDRLIETSTSDWLLITRGYPDLSRSSDGPLPAADVEFDVRHRDGRRHHQTVSLGGHPSILHARIAKSAMAFFRKVMDEASD